MNTDNCGLLGRMLISIKMLLNPKANSRPQTMEEKLKKLLKLPPRVRKALQYFNLEDAFKNNVIEIGKQITEKVKQEHPDVYYSDEILFQCHKYRIEKLLKQKEEKILTTAFDWSKTKEGSNTWNAVHLYYATGISFKS